MKYLDTSAALGWARYTAVNWGGVRAWFSDGPEWDAERTDWVLPAEEVNIGGQG